MPIKLFGSVLEVFLAQEPPEDMIREFKKNSGLAINKSQILADLPRTVLVDFIGSHTDFTDFCQNDKIYAEQYLQGNFDGGAVLDMYEFYYFSGFKKKHEEANSLPDNSTEKSQKQKEADDFFEDGAKNKKFFRFAYPDDNGTMCCLGFAFNSAKPENWIFHITANITAAQEERTANVFATGDLVCSRQGIPVAAKHVAAEISSVLNSKMVSQLISGLINSDGTICQEKFYQLKARMPGGGNIDRRDAKITLLDELFRVAINSLPKDTQLATDFCYIAKQSHNDPDFYKDGNFEKHLFKVYETITSQIKRQSLQEDVSNRALFNNLASLYAVLLDNMSAYSLPAQRKILQEQTRILREARDNPNSDFAEIIASNPIINKLPAYAKTMRQMLEENSTAEKQIVSRKTVKPQPIRQNFFERNSLLLTFGALFFLATISLILVITGVLAPLGLVLTKGMAGILGMAGTAVAGTLSLGAATVLAYNEANLVTAKEDGLSAQDKIRNDCYVCQRLHQEALSSLQSDFLKKNVIPQNANKISTQQNVANNPSLEQLFSDLETNLSEGEKIVREGLSLPLNQPVIHKNVPGISFSKKSASDLSNEDLTLKPENAYFMER